MNKTKVISLFNHKGGVGKTTLVHNLAFALGDLGQRVLLIDADPQMNLTASMYGLSTSVEYGMDES
jgi:chromosome partitioning protein